MQYNNHYKNSINSSNRYNSVALFLKDIDV